MLNLSSILVLAVIPILISGNLVNLREITPVTPDTEECQNLGCAKCHVVLVKNECPKMCGSCCGSPWYKVDGQCFQVIDRDLHLPWSSARMYCSALDPGTVVGATVRADLAQPKDLESFFSFIESTSHIRNKFWIGGSNLYRTPEKSPWLWINALPIDDHIPPTTWYEECIYINTIIIDPPVRTKLGNDGCGASLPFVCEKYPIE